MLRIRLFKSALYLFVFEIVYLYVNDYYEEAALFPTMPLKFPLGTTATTMCSDFNVLDTLECLTLECSYIQLCSDIHLNAKYFEQSQQS